MPYTYRQLLRTIQPSLNILANGTAEEAAFDYDGAETTAINYAVVKNERDVTDALQGTDVVDGFRGELEDIAHEHFDEDDEEAPSVPQLYRHARAQLFPGVESDLAGEPDVDEAIEEALGKDAPFEPYQISESDLLSEPGMPSEVISMVDPWLVEEESE